MATEDQHGRHIRGRHGNPTNAHEALVLMWDDKTLARSAVAVELKGRCEWTARRVVPLHRSFGHAKIILKTDEEKSIAALVEAVKAFRTNDTVTHNSPVG